MKSSGRRMMLVVCLIFGLALMSVLSGCAGLPGSGPIVNGSAPVFSPSRSEFEPPIRVDDSLKKIFVTGGDMAGGGFFDVSRDIADLLPSRGKVSVDGSKPQAKLDVRVSGLEIIRDVENAPTEGKETGQAVGDITVTTVANATGNGYAQAIAGGISLLSNLGGAKADRAKMPIIYHANITVELVIGPNKKHPEVLGSRLQVEISMIPSTYPPSPADDQAARAELRKAIIYTILGGVV